MAKLLSAKEAKLQKKLIPLNIFVFILSLVSAFSLFFAPRVKVDIGKILSSPGLEQTVEKALDETIGNSIQGSSQEGINYAPVITSVVGNVLGNVNGTLNITAYEASRIAVSKEDNKAEAVMNKIFFGEKGIVTELVDSLIRGLFDIFETPEGKTLVEETVVSAITSSVVSNLPAEAADKLTEEKVNELTQTFRKLDDVKNEAEAEEVVNEFVNTLGDALPDEIDESGKEEIKDYIMDMYSDTVNAVDGKEGEEFSLEAMICVAVSNNVNLGGFNINDVLSGLLGGNGEENGEENGGSDGESFEDASTVKALAEGEVPPENDGSGNGEGEVPPEEEKIICTNYTELLAEMGFNKEEADTLSKDIQTAVEDKVKTMLGDSAQYFSYYGYMFYGMLAFIVPWLLLALFSFIHIFTKNKRFTMWYVKLYSFIPGLISLALFAGRLVLSKNFIPALKALIDEETRPIAEALVNGVSSFTWISGACYIVLWLVSICWAFPIKHKIRKERKACKLAKKNGTYDFNGYKEEMGYGVTDEENYDYGADDYTDGYSDGYADTDYDDYSDDGFDDGGSDYDYAYYDDDL